MAIIARCRMPPENSCGKGVRPPPPGQGCPPGPAVRSPDAGACSRLRSWCTRRASAIWSPMRYNRRERGGVGPGRRCRCVWPPQPGQGRVGRADDLVAGQLDRAMHAGRCPANRPSNASEVNRLARPGFADQAEQPRPGTTPGPMPLTAGTGGLRRARNVTCRSRTCRIGAGARRVRGERPSTQSTAPAAAHRPAPARRSAGARRGIQRVAQPVADQVDGQHETRRAARRRRRTSRDKPIASPVPSAISVPSETSGA